MSWSKYTRKDAKVLPKDVLQLRKVVQQLWKFRYVTFQSCWTLATFATLQLCKVAKVAQSWSGHFPDGCNDYYICLHLWTRLSSLHTYSGDRSHQWIPSARLVRQWSGRRQRQGLYCCFEGDVEDQSQVRYLNYTSVKQVLSWDIFSCSPNTHYRLDMALLSFELWAIRDIKEGQERACWGASALRHCCACPRCVGATKETDSLRSELTKCVEKIQAYHHVWMKGQSRTGVLASSLKLITEIEKGLTGAPLLALLLGMVVNIFSASGSGNTNGAMKYSDQLNNHCRASMRIYLSFAHFDILIEASQDRPPAYRLRDTRECSMPPQIVQYHPHPSSGKSHHVWHVWHHASHANHTPTNSSGDIIPVVATQAPQSFVVP